MAKSVSTTKSGLSVRVGTYDGTTTSGSIDFASIGYKSANRKITRIDIKYSFSSSGSQGTGKRLYHYNGSTQLGYVSGYMFNNTVTYTFSPNSNTAIFNGLVSMFNSGKFKITYKEPTIRGYYTTSSGVKYSYEYLKITGATLTIYYEEEAYVYYGVNGEWKQCHIYYGVNGVWVQVIPYYGIDDKWVQV